MAMIPLEVATLLEVISRLCIHSWDIGIHGLDVPQATRQTASTLAVVESTPLQTLRLWLCRFLLGDKTSYEFTLL